MLQKPGSLNMMQEIAPPSSEVEEEDLARVPI